MKKISNLSPPQIVALSAVITDAKVKAAKALIGNGVTVDVPLFNLHCQGGKIVVGAEEDYTPTVKLPMLHLLVIALHKAGFQRENILSMITAAASDALKAETKVGDSMSEEIDFIEKGVEALQKSLSTGLPKQVRAGKTKVSVKWS